jgi:hypothetical protein
LVTGTMEFYDFPETVGHGIINHPNWLLDFSEVGIPPTRWISSWTESRSINQEVMYIYIYTYFIQEESTFLLAIFGGYIPLHSPYIGLLYGTWKVSPNFCLPWHYMFCPKRVFDTEPEPQHVPLRMRK